MGTIFEEQFYFECYWSESNFENKCMGFTSGESIVRLVLLHSTAFGSQKNSLRCC